MDNLTSPSGVYTFNAQRQILHPPTPSQLTNNLLFTGQLHPSLRASMPRFTASGTSQDFPSSSSVFWKKLTNLKRFVKNLPSSLNKEQKLLRSGEMHSKNLTNSYLNLSIEANPGIIEIQHEVIDLEKEPDYGVQEDKKNNAQDEENNFLYKKEDVPGKRFEEITPLR